MQVTLGLTIGILLRHKLINIIKIHCDLHDIKYDIHEYKGFISSNYIIHLDGEKDNVLYLVGQLKSMSN